MNNPFTHSWGCLVFPLAIVAVYAFGVALDQNDHFSAGTQVVAGVVLLGVLWLIASRVFGLSGPGRRERIQERIAVSLEKRTIPNRRERKKRSRRP